jgi:hypothetical protein
MVSEIQNFNFSKHNNMKTISLCAALSLVAFLGFSQATKPANVYPSNLEENMYFKSYDAKTNSITGLNFLVLSDGNNSKDKTPAFEVTLYLMPVGKTSAEDIIIVKVFKLDGIFHMGSHEFKNETISLEGIAIPAGAYRLGVWVNSNAAFTEDTSDNATLFNGSINISSTKTSLPKSEEKKKEPEQKSEEWEEDDTLK